MSNLFVYVDQLRYMGGTLLILFLLCEGVLPKRGRHGMRVVVACAVALALAVAYVPIERLGSLVGLDDVLAMLPYWSVMLAVPVAVVLACYETNLAGALFRALMASVTENSATVLFRHVLVQIFFTDLPKRPLLYANAMVMSYLIIYGIAYALMCHQVRIDETRLVPDMSDRARRYIFIYLVYSVVLGATKVMLERAIAPLGMDPRFPSLYFTLQLFLAGEMFLVGLAVGAGMMNDYFAIINTAEHEVMLQLARERAAQFEYSKEIVDMINRRAHDLKHQIGALGRIGREEVSAQLDEMSKAVDAYDAVVRTENDALDTLLTEKSVYCANRGIRFSCTVQSKCLDDIALVDLYTLLGNALDNAIEAVEQLDDDTRKVISLSIRDKGSMLVIQVENYFEGHIEMAEGLPKTTKGDKLSHGYGLRSIRSIAQRYGGDISVEASGGTFSLVVLIP